MPYADVERRRTCARESQRRRRTNLASPLKLLKVYICPRHPFLDLGPGLRFENSFLVTDQVKAQKQIEGHREFGRSIFPLALDCSRAHHRDGG
jgi:hypothetical protein